ncbi:hypothetical protein PENSPDRAFT_434670 [Peniophora sp. CONT]|nr:hypothetical protein PENSPDRAFT_434670 [Peniophora sp. CONT]
MIGLATRETLDASRERLSTSPRATSSRPPPSCRRTSHIDLTGAGTSVLAVGRCLHVLTLAEPASCLAQSGENESGYEHIRDLSCKLWWSLWCNNVPPVFPSHPVLTHPHPSLFVRPIRLSYRIFYPFTVDFEKYPAFLRLEPSIRFRQSGPHRRPRVPSRRRALFFLILHHRNMATPRPECSRLLCTSHGHRARSSLAFPLRWLHLDTRLAIDVDLFLMGRCREDVPSREGLEGTW